MNQGALCSRVQETPYVGVNDPAHPFCFAYPDHQRVQRIMLAAVGAETIREPEEIFLVNLVQYGSDDSLDDFVLKRRHGERALPSIGLRYVSTPGGLRPVRSPMDPGGQIQKLVLKVCLIVLPPHAVHAWCRISPEGEKPQPQQVNRGVVKKRGEPFLLPLPCGLPYALQRLGHAFPVLRPARALLARVLLGLRPSLCRLRCRSPGFVRRLPRYYDGV
jgi:hypothetical protein